MSNDLYAALSISQGLIASSDTTGSRIFKEARLALRAARLVLTVVRSEIVPWPALGAQQAWLLRRLYRLAHASGSYEEFSQEFPLNDLADVAAACTRATRCHLLDLLLIPSGEDCSGQSPLTSGVGDDSSQDAATAPCSDSRSPTNAERGNPHAAIPAPTTTAGIVSATPAKSDPDSPAGASTQEKAVASRPCHFCQGVVRADDYFLLLETAVASDLPWLGLGAVQAEEGIHRCKINRNGARTVASINLGIKPSECHDVCGDCARRLDSDDDANEQVSGSSPVATAEDGKPMVEAAPVPAANHTEVPTGGTADAAPPGSAPGIATGVGGQSSGAEAPAASAPATGRTPCPLGQCDGSGFRHDGACLCRTGVTPPLPTPKGPVVVLPTEPMTPLEVRSRLGASRHVDKWAASLCSGSMADRYIHMESLLARAETKHGKDVVMLAWRDGGGQLTRDGRRLEAHNTPKGLAQRIVWKLPRLSFAGDFATRDKDDDDQGDAAPPAPGAP